MYAKQPTPKNKTPIEVKDTVIDIRYCKTKLECNMISMVCLEFFVHDWEHDM